MRRIEDSKVLDLLSSLVDKSLVVYEENEHGQGRYRLLETVRQYGRERLVESGETDAVRGRQFHFFFSLAEVAEDHLTGPEQAGWLDRLEAEHDDLRAALDWCLGEEDGIEAALRLSGVLSRFWSIRSYVSEGREWLRRSLHRAEQAELAGVSFSPIVRSRALYWAGVFSRALADREAALDFYDQSLTLSRQAGDQAGIAFALCGLGRCGMFVDDPAEVRGMLEESLTLFRQLGDPFDIAVALNALGDLAFYQGDYVSAQALYEEDSTLRRQVGDQRGLANSLGRLGTVASTQGDLDTARTLFEEARTLASQVGDEHGVAASLINSGVTAFRRGDPAAAQDLLREALTISWQLDPKIGVPFALNGLGKLACHRGDYAAARALFKESLLQQHSGLTRSVVYTLEGFAGVAHGQHHSRRAAQLLGAADTLRPTHRAPYDLIHQNGHDEFVAAVRETLGEETFSSAWASGQAMSLEQATAHALTEGPFDEPR